MASLTSLPESACEFNFFQINISKMSGDEGLNFLHKICQYLDRDHNTLKGKYEGRVPKKPKSPNFGTQLNPVVFID